MKSGEPNPEGPRGARRAERRDMNRGESDVEATVAWCDRCTGERQWLKTQVDVSAAEEVSDVPDVRQAITGETGWVCQNCGNFRRDLIAEEAYDYESSDVGYTVHQFRDEAQTTDVPGVRGVDPPERVAEAVDRQTPTNVADTPRERREEEPDPRESDTA